jgi:hypothetical protein
MSLKKNVASQVLTFDLVNATTGASLTGASVTTKVALDGTQGAGAGTVTELGTGQYKYVPTQGETNGTSVGFSFTASNAVPVNLHCFTVATADQTLAADMASSFTTVNGSLTTLAGYVDTEVAAIKAKTDNLPTDPADASDLAASFATVNATLSTLSGYVDTEVAAIKAKTDLIPATPVTVGDIPTAAVIADAVFDEPTSGHTTAGTYGDKFGAHLKAVLKVVVGTGSTTTAVVLNSTTGIDGAAPSSTDDFYMGRVLIFTSGAMAGQATSISAYNGTSKTLTVVAVTDSAIAGVTAVIV